MNKSVISVIILLFSLLGMGVNAQDNKITINGMIADATTGEPIPFANLGVLGTLAGVASDMDGKFELVLPDNYADRIIRVSVVGYASYEIKVAEAGQKGFFHFVGYGVRKKYDQVRASDLLAQACGHLGEYFCLAVEPSADLLILTYHSVMAAYDHNTHIEPPDDNEDNCACF